MRRFALGCSVALLFTVHLHAQQPFTTGPCNADDGNTGDRFSFLGHHARACELRRTTLPLVNGQLNVSGNNGGIEVVGEDRQDIAFEARVVAQGSSREHAESTLHQIKIVTDGAIEAQGPHFSGWSDGGWSVSYRLRVPRHLAANLRTENGDIELTNLDGAIHADTTNGGLTLMDLAGEVHATTVNGGLHVTLAGSQWQGSGLVAKSTNGGVSIKAPDHYSAHLIAETVNGGISVNFPVTVQGNIRSRLETNLGQGGATLQFQTVNGGVSIARN